MRKILITLNILLLAAVVYSAFTWITRSSASEPQLTVKKRTGRKKVQETTVKRNEPVTSVISVQDRIEYLKNHNIFDSNRVPNARVPGGGNRNNARVTMTLVGTFKIGKLEGAIILQKRQQNNRFNNMMPPWMMNRGGMFDRPNNNGSNNNIFSRNNSGGNRNNNNNNNNWSRQRFMPGMMGGGRWFGQNQQQEEEKIVYQQYIRVGEILDNGYTLASVSRVGAVLTKGSEKLELILQEASKNQTTNSSQNNRNNRFNNPGFPGMMGGGFPGFPGMMGGGFPGFPGGGFGNNNFNNNNNRFMQNNNNNNRSMQNNNRGGRNR